VTKRQRCRLRPSLRADSFDTSSRNSTYGYTNYGILILRLTPPKTATQNLIKFVYAVSYAELTSSLITFFLCILQVDLMTSEKAH